MTVRSNAAERLEILLGHLESIGRRRLVEVLAARGDLPIEACVRLLAAAPLDAAVSPARMAAIGIHRMAFALSGGASPARSKRGFFV